MSLKCHFDADGWLQGPIRITHVMTPNRFNSGFAEHALGVVYHTEDGHEGGTVATFLNPSAQASAFFSVGEDGSAHQYLPVGRGFVAWAEAGGNPSHYSIETEDGTHPSIPLTRPQLTAFAQIFEALAARDGFPLQVTDSPAGRGLVLHSDGGQAWGGHLQCPGPVRAAQRPQIVALAMSIRQDATLASDWQEALMNKLPTLKQGAADKAGQVFFVHRVQALARVYGEINNLAPAASLMTTGTFDAATKAGIQAVQANKKLAADGIVGPQTWGVLIAGSAQ